MSRTCDTSQVAIGSYTFHGRLLICSGNPVTVCSANSLVVLGASYWSFVVVGLLVVADSQEPSRKPDSSSRVSIKLFLITMQCTELFVLLLLLSLLLRDGRSIGWETLTGLTVHLDWTDHFPPIFGKIEAACLRKWNFNCSMHVTLAT